METSENIKCFGERLKNLREALNYTQIKMANLLNVSQSAYSEYEAGKRTIHIITLNKIKVIFSDEILAYLLCLDSILPNENSLISLLEKLDK